MKFIKPIILILAVALSEASAESLRGSAGLDTEDDIVRFLDEAGGKYELVEALPDGVDKETAAKAAHDSDSMVEDVVGGGDFDPESKAEPELDENRPTVDDDESKVIIGKDDRYFFSDTRHPFRTVGRIYGNGGCTGTMVGRRIMITAQHCVEFTSGDNFKPFKFSPAYNGKPNSQIGTANADKVYYWNEINPDDGLTDEEVANDYVLVVLDRPIGDKSGYLGYKTWQDSWKNKKAWVSIGYPGDKGNTKKPVFCPQEAVTDVKSFDGGKFKMLTHEIDIYKGQSGSPIYGQFGSGYFLVGVHSAENKGEHFNCGAGGSMLSSIIKFGRKEYP